MSDLRARDLRNDLSDVLRRVQAGERLRVTLRGRPVAVLAPVEARPTTVSWGAFQTAVERNAADRQLLEDLRAAAPQMTDDI